MDIQLYIMCAVHCEQCAFACNSAFAQQRRWAPGERTSRSKRRLAGRAQQARSEEVLRPGEGAAMRNLLKRNTGISETGHIATWMSDWRGTNSCDNNADAKYSYRLFVRSCTWPARLEPRTDYEGRRWVLRRSRCDAYVHNVIRARQGRA